ncbi:MAG: hypothetical protein WA869_18305, partial [Alloacidobacterium sp.]
MPSVKTETTAAELACTLEAFLVEHPRAAVLEDGRVLFEMQAAHYALSSEHGRCSLHIWSEDRNMVRTVTDLAARKNVLRLETRRFGQTKPQALQLVPDRDTRTPTTREATRKKYLRVLERVMTRAFPDFTLDSIGNAMDLEHSFGPAYARGAMVRGPKAWAVIAVNAEETQATIDGALTLGILWLAYCRERSGGRRVFEGLKVIVPTGIAAVTRGRMAWLNPALAKWELYELDERCETLESAQISFRLHGLEFARIRHGLAAGSFARQDKVTFGAGPNETPLTNETEDLFRELLRRVYDGRFVGGSVRNPLF